MKKKSLIKKRALIKKRILMLLGCLLVVGIALGGGYALRARAATKVKKTVGEDGNTTLGSGEITKQAEKALGLSDKMDVGELTSYEKVIYLGKDKDGEPTKFQLLRNQALYFSESTIENSDIQVKMKNSDSNTIYTSNVLWLESTESFGMSSYDDDGVSVVDKLNGSDFYTDYLSATEKRALIGRDVNGKEAVSLPCDWVDLISGEGSDGLKQMYRVYMLKDNSYWVRSASDTEAQYVDAEGTLKTRTGDESLDMYPSVFLDPSKILFSTKVSDANYEEDLASYKSDNITYKLVSTGEYKLTLIDDKLKLSVTEGKSATIDEPDEDTKPTVTIPYTVSDKTGDDRDITYKVLVTKGEWNAEDSEIIDYEDLQGTDKGTGSGYFQWNRDWDDYYFTTSKDATEKYHVYLIAEKQSGDYSTDVASEPCELSITKTISSVDVTFEAPLRSDDAEGTGWKNNTISITDLEKYGTLKVTGFNGKSLSDDGQKEFASLITGSLADISGSDKATYADFNTKYNAAIKLAINNADNAATKYSFSEDGVTINVKILTTDKETEENVKATEVKVTTFGESGKDNTEVNTSSAINANFDFTTRKAKVLSVTSPTGGTSATIEYSATYKAVQEQLKDQTATVQVESIKNGQYQETSLEKVPITWGGEPDGYNAKDTDGSTFLAWGKINADEKSYDSNGVKCWILVIMSAQKQVDMPKVSWSGWMTTESTEVTLYFDEDDQNNLNGCTIYYTLDGSIPTSKSTEYKAGDKIKIESPEDEGRVDVILKAIAVKENWKDSKILSKRYMFQGKVTINVLDGMIEGQEGTKKDSGTEYKIRRDMIVEITATDKTTKGKKFDHWEIESSNGYVDKTKKVNPLTYDVNSNDKKITAIYRDIATPVIKTQPTNQSVADGNTATYTIDVEGSDDFKDTGSIIYQWQKKAADDKEFKDISDSKNVEGTTTNTLSIKNTTLSQSGETYRCIVKYKYTDNKDEETKTLKENPTEVSLTVLKNADKLKVTDPTSVAVKEGKDASFEVKATAGYEGDTLAYQWQKKAADAKDFVDIEGATSSKYTVKDPTEKKDDGAQYRCLVTELDKDGKAISWGDNATGTTESAAATLTVTKENVYTVSVENGTTSDKATTYKAGVTVTIKATVPDGKEFAKWECDDSDVKFESAKSETTTFTMPKKDVTVKAVFVDAHSIEITKQPENVTASVGKTATFTVEAVSAYDMSYEWQVDYHDGKGYNRVGSETSYTVSKVTKSMNAASFRCVISLKDDPTVTVTTTEVVLNVEAADYTVTVNGGTASPDSCKAGDTVTIKANDAAEGKVFKQWKVVSGGANLADTTSSETTFTMPASDVKITAEYKEENGIQITKQPESASIPEGGSVTFAVKATSDHSLNYLWQEDKGDGKGFQSVGTKESYTISSVTSSMNGARYRCVITANDDTDVTITTSEAVLTVSASTYTIKVNDGTASASESTAGETITITANAAPDGQEFEKWVVVSGKANLADVTSSETTFTMPAGNVEVTAKYQDQVAVPTVSKQPENATVYAGSSTSFSVEGSGDELSYQWQVDKSDGNGYQDISGATTATYRVYTEDCSMNGYKYRCVITNRAGSVNSDEVTLTVSYKITQGAGASWQKNSSSGLTFKGSGAYKKFQYIKVDGERVSGSEYTKSSDPTVITLSATYLQKLINGTHTLTMIWDDGTAETTFVVGGTATSSSTSSSSGSTSTESTAKSSGSTTKSNSSTGSSIAKSSQTSDASESSETGTVDMPIVNKSKSSNSTDSSTGTTTSKKKSSDKSGSTKSLEEDSTESSSLLNRYAAIISLVVVALCALGILFGFIIRKVMNKEDDGPDFE